MKTAGSGSASESISQRHGSTDPDPDPHQNAMDQQHWMESREKKIYIYSQQCQFTMFFLPHKWLNCHVVEYFGQHIEIF
jgi:hypothetical protein